MKKLIYIVLLAILPFWAQAQIGMSIQKASPDPFVSTWNTNNINTVGDPTNQIILPLITSGSYAFVVDWGDGSTSVVTNANMSTNATHVYGVSGIYTLTITGRILGWRMPSSESKKITEISQWGTLKPGALGFFNCENLLISATDTLDIENNLGQMFQGCSSLVSLDTSNWDTSSGTNMENMFSGCSSLENLDVSGWDTSSVTNMSGLFLAFEILPMGLSDLDTSSVTNFSGIFQSITLTSLDLSNWDVSLVTNFNNMFAASKLITIDMTSWDVSSGINFSGMFGWTNTIVGLDVSGWDVSSGTNFNTFINNFGMTTAIYDQTLVNWEALNLQPGAGETINFGSSKYTAGSAAETARTNIIANDGWVISDGGSTP